MQSSTLILALVSMLGWGVGGFVAKIASNRIGNHAVFWEIVGYTLVAVIWAFCVLKSGVASADRLGIGLALVAGVVGSVGGVLYFVLLARESLGLVTALTALYPLVAVVLGVVFLHESVTIQRIVGVLFAVVAVYLLSI